MHPMSPSRPSSAPCSNGATSPFDPDPSVAAAIGLALIRAYKVLISPWFAGSCRFVPGCADYTSEAIARHGLLRGIWLGARRLGRCHPFGGHGYDPVPRRQYPSQLTELAHQWNAAFFSPSPSRSWSCSSTRPLRAAATSSAGRHLDAPVRPPAAADASATAGGPPAASPPDPAPTPLAVEEGESSEREMTVETQTSAPSSRTAARDCKHWMLKRYLNEGGEPLDLIPAAESVNNALRAVLAAARRSGRHFGRQRRALSVRRHRHGRCLGKPATIAFACRGAGGLRASQGLHLAAGRLRHRLHARRCSATASH